MHNEVWGCAEILPAWVQCRGSWRYGFDLFLIEICVRSCEYIYEGSFGHLHIV